MWLELLHRIAGERPVVLGYHGIGRARRSEDLFRLVVSPDHFRRHVELLLAAGFRFVTVAELADRLDGDPPPAGLAAITFDDGLRSNYTTALPILARLGIPATVYVTTGLIGGRSPWVGSAIEGQMLNEDEIRELAAAGWEIGAHTDTHADLSTLDYASCRDEIERSRAALEQLTGRDIETFAYPFGRYGDAAIAAAHDLGLKAAVTTGSGSWAPLELTRAMVSAGDPMPVLLLKLTDRYETLLTHPPLSTARAAGKQIRALAVRQTDDSSTPRPPTY